jgi:hypothetical protein
LLRSFERLLLSFGTAYALQNFGFAAFRDPAVRLSELPPDSDAVAIHFEDREGATLA